MRKVWAIALKEIRQVSRDPLSMFMLLGVPLMMLVLYGYALSFDVHDATLAVEDRDVSDASRALVDAFVQSGRFDLVGSVEPATAETVLGDDRARAILVVPKGYERQLKAGRQAVVQILVDGADSTTATTVLGYAQGIVGAVGGTVLARQLAGAGVGPALEAAIDVRPRVWYNPELDSTQFLVPGLIAFILMLTSVLSTALSVVREDERGTIEQLRVAPLRSPQILLGKMAPYLVLSFAGMGLILVGARVLFDVHVRGPYPDLFLATLLYLVGGLAWGLLLSTLANSQAVAFQLGMMTALLPTLLLSGFVFPLRNMPEALQALSHIVPARYYLVILRGIVIKGAGLGPYWDQMGYLAVYVVLVLGLAAVRFARKGWD